MARFFNRDIPLWWRKGSAVFLALSWIAGLVFGVVLYVSAGESIVSLMPGTLRGTVSIVGLLTVTVLPFLFSAFAVFISEPGLLLLVSFGKACLFSLVSLSVFLCFGSAGWLIRWLLMFADLVSVPVLYWFWQRHISGEAGFSAAGALFMLSVFLLIGSVDYCCVSPFLANLINS